MRKRSTIMSSEPVFLFGNGVSRKDFDVSSLAGKGKLVGCNWAYQEYAWDIICSADPEVSAKIDKNWDGDWIRRDDFSNKHCHRDNVYWNTHDELICTLPQLGYAMGWNTGGMAIYTLVHLYRPKKLYLFGFDLDRTNIYTAANMTHRWKTAPDNYLKGWNSLFSRIEPTEIIRVGPHDNIGDRLTCGHMTYDEFKVFLGDTDN